MKAITYSSYGPPSVLTVDTVADPKPKDDEILIRVRAAEATKADCEMRAFKFSVKWFWLPLRVAVGIRKPRKKVLGGYFSGEVAAVGNAVEGFKQGDEVFGSCGLGFGAYGEYLTISASGCVVSKPSNMSFVEAAAVPLGGLNALHFMRRADIQEGDRVLINGAGGSIGTHAIQIAKSMGAEVTAVDSAAKQGLIEQMGADHFIDYTQEDFTQRTNTFDVLFDMVPNSNYAGCIGSLKAGGRYLCGNPSLKTMMRSLVTSRFTDKSASFAFARETTDELAALKEMIEAGKLRSIVGHTFSMEQAPAAHRLVETEQRVGAVVISIS